MPPSRQIEQSRINKLRCVSMKSRCCCVVDASFKGSAATSTAGSVQRRITKHNGGFRNWVKEPKPFHQSDHFIKSNPAQRRRNLLPGSVCFQSTGKQTFIPFVGTRRRRNEAPNQYKRLKVTAFSKSQRREKRNTDSAAVIAYSHGCDWCVINW